MKKFFATVIALVMFAAQVEAVELTSADSTFAVETINNTLRDWKCTPLKIWYSGTPLNDAENVAYMNQLANGQKITACMLFYSDFRSPSDPHDGKVTAWNYDAEYKNYSWYFALYTDGTWKLMTYGY